MTVKTSKAEPERTCIITREAGSTNGLIRFAVGPEGVVVPDLAAKLPGRGMWVSARASVLTQAVTGKAFARAAKRQVKVPPDLVERVTQQLAQHALQSLSLARRAGLAIAGTEKVQAALSAGKVAWLLHVSDAADDGIAKLRAGEEVRVCRLFDREPLCQIMGRDNLAHVAVLKGQGSAGCVEALTRFTGFME